MDFLSVCCDERLEQRRQHGWPFRRAQITLSCIGYSLGEIMAKKARAKAKPSRRRITLIESSEKPDAIRARLKAPRGKRPVEVELFVRSPDRAAAKALAVTARLCACRR